MRNLFTDTIDGNFIKISDYNKMLKLKGEKGINLNKNEVLILSNYNENVKKINKKLKNNNKVYIKEREYLVKNHRAIEENLYNFVISYNFCTIVINDEFLSDYKISKSLLNIMYSDKNREENNEKYNKIYKDSINGKYRSLNSPYINAFSKDDIYFGAKRGGTSVLFVGIYLGMVFLIASTAVLALQQLSEASDSIERYKALKRIGANKKMIDKTIFAQTFIYFSLPVILALIHSVVGIAVINDYFSLLKQTNSSCSVIITILIFIVIYVGYFYITYVEYKNIVKSNI